MENIFPSFQSLADSVAAADKFPSWNITVAQAHVIATDDSMGQGTRTKRMSGFIHGRNNTYVAIEILVTPTTMGTPTV